MWGVVFTACVFFPSYRVTTCNSNFQQLAKDKKLNPNQWVVHLIEFCEVTGLMSESKSTAQRAYLRPS
jgi:hypothetical protein